MGESGEPAPQAVPTSDAELIKAAASGDAAAYARLRERHTAAARNLAGRLVTDPAAAQAVLSQTFAQVGRVLRRGEGPTEALRPFLLTALRRVAHERQEGRHADTDASDETIPNLGEPLFTDPAAAELENDPLARAFRSLPERHRAVLWHTEIERADPAETAALLGLTADGLAQAGGQARAAVARGYLDLHASARAGLECEEAAAKIDRHLAGRTRGADEAMVQRHLRSCRDCRGAAIQLTGLSRSLRRTVAPIFLGPAADAYLEAAAAKPAQAGTAVPGPAAAASAWLSHAPRRIAQVQRRIREAPRQHRALAGGAVMLAAIVAAGLTLTLAANGSPPPAQRPVSAAIAPPTPPAGSPSPSLSPSVAPPRPARTTRPVKQTSQRSPAPRTSASPSPSTSASPSPAPSPTSSPSPRPTPSPSPPPHHKHHHPPAAAA